MQNKRIIITWLHIYNIQYYNDCWVKNRDGINESHTNALTVMKQYLREHACTLHHWTG